MKSYDLRTWWSAVRLGALLLLLLLSNLAADSGYPSEAEAQCEECEKEIGRVLFDKGQVEFREGEEESVGARWVESTNWSPGPRSELLATASVSPATGTSTTLSMKAVDDLILLSGNATNRFRVINVLRSTQRVRAGEAVGSLQVIGRVPQIDFLTIRGFAIPPTAARRWSESRSISRFVRVRDAGPGSAWNFLPPSNPDVVDSVTLTPTGSGQAAQVDIILSDFWNLRGRRSWRPPIDLCFDDRFMLFEATNNGRRLIGHLTIHLFAKEGTPPCPAQS